MTPDVSSITRSPSLLPFPFPTSTIAPLQTRQLDSSSPATIVENSRLGADNSGTMLSSQVTQINKLLGQIFSSASSEILEDGQETVFADELENVVKNWGSLAVSLIAHRMNAGKVKGIVVSKALATLGQINNFGTYHFRLHTLETLLFSQFYRVRNSACLGLSLFNDKHSLAPALKAFEEEKIPEIKMNLKRLIQQLESKADVPENN